MNKVQEPIETYNQVGLGLGNYIETRKLYPILKWAGGKEQELKYIIPNLPNKFVITMSHLLAVVQFTLQFKRTTISSTTNQTN